VSKIAFLEKRIQQEIESYCKKFPLSPPELYDPIKYTISNGGKRIRPVITLLASDLFSDNIEKVIPAAIGIELFHNFTLVHDDLMDNAPVRRNNPTVHEKWNKNIAILSGDVMLVKAYQLMSQTESKAIGAILTLFNNTAVQVCEGQQLDMNYEKIFRITIPKYLNMIELKTAVLIATSFKIGALIGGAKEEDAQRLYNFGKYLGVAFQLQDDILDVYGDQKKFGKQKGGDIISNKKTYLLIKAMEMANRYTAEELNNWIYAPQFDPQQKVEAVTAIYDFLNVKELAKKEMEKQYTRAMDCLNEIPLEAEKKQELLSFIKSLISRES
jgi:geranylgeranyl diphosphate synthase type II